MTAKYSGVYQEGMAKKATASVGRRAAGAQVGYGPEAPARAEAAVGAKAAAIAAAKAAKAAAIAEARARYADRAWERNG